MATSYWMESAPGPGFGQLAHDIDVDVAVIGAGIVGICTAHELIRRGQSVALLEAGEVASGTSGYTTAKVTSQHTLIYDRLQSTLGSDAARLYATSQQDALAHVSKTTQELAIDCDFEAVAAHTWVDSSTNADIIRAEVDAALAAGLPAKYVEEIDIPGPVGAAIQVENQAQFHPRKYLLGVLADVVRRGGQVYENSRVVSVDLARQHGLTTANDGHVRAGRIVIATQFPILDRTILFPRLMPGGEWVVAGPIPIERAPEGTFITPDVGLRSVRTAPLDSSHRLLIVTGETAEPGARGSAARLDRLTRWARATFPEWRCTHHWWAEDYTSTDRVPYVGRCASLNDNLFAATGFGGWGMTNGVMSAKLLAALITGEDVEWADLYDPLRRLSLNEVKPLVTTGVSVTRHLLADRLTAPTGRANEGELEDLPNGSGKVIRDGLRWLAVARDDDGAAHVVSARCTHLGCLVGFNEVDKVWECPCHGSRFSMDGDILHGPATAPLDRDVSAGSDGPGVDDVEG